MVSTWTEYLRLNVIGDGSALLEICQYEILAEAEDSEDSEDDEDRPLPDKIEGKEVFGKTHDGYLIGGDLICGDEQDFSFTGADIEAALQWLSHNNWQVTKQMADELRNAVKI